MMTRDVVLCQTGDLLHYVWARIRARGLKNIYVTDQDFRPLGVLNARDALQVLLKESIDEEAMLRDCVMCAVTIDLAPLNQAQPAPTRA